jgi:HSP20 family protein
VPRGFVPKLEIAESDEAYTVSAELPGVKQDDLEVVIEDNVLTLKGEKKNERESEEDGVRRSELSFGSFERRVAFRSPIDEDAVKASYVDGLLTITIPKPEEARPKVRTVPVETA